VWSSIALVAAVGFVPAEAATLTATNVRTTYGVLGAPRPDTKFLPGDDFVLSFDIEGAKVNAAGKVLYAVAMDVNDNRGKVRFRQLPNDLEVDAPANGQRIPACAKVQIGLDQEPGPYTVKVSVTDRVAGATREITRSCEVLPKAFGLVRLTTTRDPEAKIPAPAFRQGQTGWINFAAVGFGRGKSSGLPHVNVVLRVLDQAGRSISAKPWTGEISKDVPGSARALPMQFALAINRPGKYTAELTATDQITGQSASLSLPLDVAKAK
jgi:hypothetical protein